MLFCYKQYVGKGLDLRSYNNFDRLMQRESLVTLCLINVLCQYGTLIKFTFSSNQ